MPCIPSVNKRLFHSIGLHCIIRSTTATKDAMYTLSRRAFAKVAAAIPVTVMPAWAQIGGTTGKVIVGYPAGGTLDVTARHMVEAFRKKDRAYIVDNRAGAAGRIANSQLKREKADGSALLCTHTSALTIYPHVYARLMYDASADFIPISPVVSVSCAFAVSNIVPTSVKTLQEYFSWVRANPAQATYASPAAGSLAHFLGFQLSEAGNLKLQHIPYRGSAPAMQDLIGGQIPAYMGFVADFMPYLQSGKVRILGTVGERRSRFMPNIATFAEQGLPQVRGTESYGVFAPPGTPESVVQQLNDSVVAASKDPTMRAAFEQIGLEVYTLSPPEYGALIKRDRDVWRPIVQASGFRSED